MIRPPGTRSFPEVPECLTRATTAWWGTAVAPFPGNRDGPINPAPDTPMIRTHWRSIACAMAALLAASSASAQRVTLRGQVVDAASGQPVAAAVVEVMPRREQAVTDAQGRFTLRTTLGEHVIMAD